MLNDADDTAALNTDVEVAAPHPSAETAVSNLPVCIGSTNHAVENIASNCADYTAVLSPVVDTAAPFLDVVTAEIKPSVYSAQLKHDDDLNVEPLAGTVPCNVEPSCPTHRLFRIVFLE